MLCYPATAQENYEIQVYGSETVAKDSTMLELHSNYTFGGSRGISSGVLPTHHIIHETVEITHGFNSWFETGFYFFNALGNENRSTYVGSHIRPRVRIPDKWHWPLGLSLSAEVGYQKREYSEDDWSLELRPIIDKTWGKFYVSFNPVLERSLHGLNVNQGFVFSPNLKLKYDINKYIALGTEYYGAVGTFNGLFPFPQEEHQVFIAADLDLDPNVELNFGYGWGFTSSTDNAIFKVIFGYRIGNK